MTRILSTILILVLAVLPLYAQEDLMSLIEDDDQGETKPTTATFKSTRLVNGHTTEVRPEGVLEFVISHRFGTLNQGIGDLFGLDDSHARFALEYGLSDKLNVGFGRSSVGKVLDGFVKYRLLRQSSGSRASPLTLTGFSSIALATGPGAFTDPSRDNKFSQRLSYTYQFLAARKFNRNFSLQLMPTIVHRNIVVSSADPNDIVAFGIGGRHKLSNRVSLNAEYFLQLTDTNQPSSDSFSVGFDIETGGHVFQLHLTNSVAMIERGFITETSGSWADGDIHFGFNVSRVFNLKTKK